MTEKTEIIKHEIKLSLSPRTTLELLTILLVILKLTGDITLDWVWVLAPVWGALALALAVIAAGFLVGLIQYRKQRETLARVEDLFKKVS